MARSPKPEPSELQIALDNRAFEIQLFWQRSNYFMVLMTALGVGVFAIKDVKYAIIISIFATITSWLWYKTNLGSKFWQESWEVEVVNLSKEQNIRAFKRPTSEVIEQVRQSFEEASSSGQRGVVQKWIDRQILEKPSVSYYMTLLSLISTALWGSVSVVQFYDFAESHQIFSRCAQPAEPKKALTSRAQQTQQVTKPDQPLNRQREKVESPNPQRSGSNKLASP